MRKRLLNNKMDGFASVWHKTAKRIQESDVKTVDAASDRMPLLSSVISGKRTVNALHQARASKKFSGFFSPKARSNSLKTRSGTKALTSPDATIFFINANVSSAI